MVLPWLELIADRFLDREITHCEDNHLVAVLANQVNQTLGFGVLS